MAKVEDVEELLDALELAEVECMSERLVRDELQALGYDLLALQQKFKTAFVQAVELVVPQSYLPPYISAEDHIMLHAASGSDEQLELIKIQLDGDYGEIEMRFRPITDGHRPGTVEISWKTSRFYPEGLWLEVLRPQETEPVLTWFIGEQMEGTIILTTAQLGFDPTKDPYRFSIRRAAPDKE